MIDVINDTLEEFRSSLARARDAVTIESLRVAYLGKKGRIRHIAQSLRELDPEERPRVAAVFNKVKDAIEQELAAAAERIQQHSMRHLDADWIDLTLPNLGVRRGTRHPVSIVQHRCLELLRRFGFSLVTGPEVETPYYNFDALNIPENHPARDMQDTFWVENNLVLRSHTTPVQARVLHERRPLPIKVASAGRVYRNEAVDATHLAMFHQLEGFWVDRGISFAHLRGIIELVARALYGQERRFRLKPKFYPYTEPSVGMDVQCVQCEGRGCDACHGAGWITIIGAGMIHRNVLLEFGYDPADVSGIAFGWGTTRMAAQWIGLSKVRWLYEADMRYRTEHHRGAL